MEGRQRRRFSKEFKAEAVRMVLDESRTIREVANDLDLWESSLGNWVRQAEVDRRKEPEGALTSNEKEELRRLRRQAREQEKELEFLKKACAFFAREQPK